MALAVFLQFFTRYVLNDSFAWTEEIATYCLVGVVFLGSAMCVRLRRHIHVDFCLPLSAAGRRRGCWRPRSTSCASLSSPTRPSSSGASWTIIGDETMTTINLPKNLVYCAVFAGFVLMFVRSVQVAVENWRQRLFHPRAARRVRRVV